MTLVTVAVVLFPLRLKKSSVWVSWSRRRELRMLRGSAEICLFFSEPISFLLSDIETMSSKLNYRHVNGKGVNLTENTKGMR